MTDGATSATSADGHSDRTGDGKGRHDHRATTSTAARQATSRPDLIATILNPNEDWLWLDDYTADELRDLAGQIGDAWPDATQWLTHVADCIERQEACIADDRYAWSHR